jgi:acyl-CoA synthetase (AMP-forming)/AMP-acid ligase II
MTHPKVQCAAVVGLPDAVKGEVPVAAVELRAGAAATAEDICGFCRGHIASYKVPVQVVFLRSDQFPRTNTGKVEKMALRRVMAAHLGHPSAP